MNRPATLLLCFLLGFLSSTVGCAPKSPDSAPKAQPNLGPSKIPAGARPPAGPPR